jgi:hypothetical protein
MRAASSIPFRYGIEQFVACTLVVSLQIALCDSVCRLPSLKEKESAVSLIGAVINSFHIHICVGTLPSFGSVEFSVLLGVLPWVSTECDDVCTTNHRDRGGFTASPCVASSISICIETYQIYPRPHKHASCVFNAIQRWRRTICSLYTCGQFTNCSL